MNIGFNVIEKNEYIGKIFDKRMSIIKFIQGILNEGKLPSNFAVYGIDNLLYYAEDQDYISKYIRNLLQDKANYLIRNSYIVQIIIDGKLEVIGSSDRPKIQYKDKELLLYPIFGRVKQIDLKHFIAPLNLSS